MSIVIVEGDHDGSMRPTLEAIARGLLDSPGDCLMGLYHYGDAIEARSLDALGSAVQAAYSTAPRGSTGTGLVEHALRAVADRLRSGEDLLATDFLGGLAISLRHRVGVGKRIRLTAVGVDGTVYQCTSTTGNTPVCAEVVNGTALLRADPVVSGLDAVLDAVVRERDRAHLDGLTEVVGSWRGKDSHTAIGIWNSGDGPKARPLLALTDLIDRHLAVTGDLDLAIERAGTELRASAPLLADTGLAGTGLISIDRNGLVPLVVGNAVCGTRLHLAAWQFEADAPVTETCPWHEIAPGNRRFVAALRALTEALTGPVA